MGAKQRLKELGITLPAPPEPFGTYVEAVETGNLLFLTGMLPTEGREAKFIGRIGAERMVGAASANFSSGIFSTSASKFFITRSSRCTMWGTGSPYRELCSIPRREELAQLLHRSKITLRKRIHDVGQDNTVGAMRQVSSMIEHVDPDLAVADYAGDRRLTKDLARSDRRDDKSRVFQKIPDCLPGQFQTAFETMNDAFLFQLGQSGGPPLESLAKPGERIVKTLKASCPRSIGFHRDNIN